MRALLSVEFRRMLARRLVFVFTVLAFVAIIVAAVITAVTSKPFEPAVQRQVVADRGATLQACLQDGPDWPPTPKNLTRRELCEQIIGPVFVPDQRFHLTGLRDVFLATSVILAAGGWLLGASFIGAEWHAGTLATLLTWEPRRLRVFVAKAVAAAAVVFLLALLLQAVLGLVLAAVAALRGTTEGAGAAWLRSVTGVGLRVGALAGMAAAMGFAVATVRRNTAAALGVGFVYLAVVEGLVRGLRPQWQRWLIGDNASVFLTGQENSFPPLNRSPLGAAGLLAAYTAVLLVAALVSFRNRDVT